MFPKTNSAAATTNPYLSGNFAPVMNEITVSDLVVRGSIPTDLNGRLLRIGPNPVGQPEPSQHHWFMGNGMVHGIEIRGGQALSYRNRFVVDSRVAATLHKPQIGRPERTQNYPVNTNVISINGKIYALVESGPLPVQLDTELNSVSRSDFGGSLKGGFVAHPRKDPRTGELHAIAYQSGQNKVSYIVVDKFGIARDVADIATSHSPMIHDTAITSSYVVILDLPVSFDFDMIASGRFPYRWNNRIEARIGLLPRENLKGSIEWFDAPSCFVFHILNAYESGQNVIIDVVKYPKMFDKHLDGPREGKTMLVRWSIDLNTKRVSESILDDREIEFPRMNESRTGLPYQFGYSAMFRVGLQFGSIYKHDVVAKKTEEHNFGTGLMSSEPIFVHRTTTNNSELDSQEDSGWILSCVFNEAKNQSEVHIIDAQNFSDDAVAIIELPVRVPFGFHGNWISDSEHP